MQRNDLPRLLEHQSRCQQIEKQAYHQHLVKLAAGFLGQEGTLRLQPGRAAMGALAGGALGAGGAHLAGLENPYARALAMGLPALAGGAMAGFTRPTEDQLQYELAKRQMEMQAQAMLADYKGQLSSGVL